MGDPLANYGVGDTPWLLGFDDVATQVVTSASCIAHSFSNGMSSASITWAFREIDVLGFVAQVLGYARSGGAGGNIDRFLPARHPVFRDLWASRIDSITPVAIQRPSKATFSRGEFSNWKNFKAVVRYESPPYAIKDSVSFEYERFTIPSVESHSEFRQRFSGSFRFPTTAPGVWGSGASVITGGTSIQLTKTKISLKWIQVPDKGLFAPNGWDGQGAGGATATGIENCIGRINDATFMGRPRGTMLLESWHPEPTTFAADSLIYGSIPDGLPFRAWNVTLNFVYFNPEVPSGANTDSGDGFDKAYGHNLLPCPINKKWYRVYVLGNAPGSAPTDSSQTWNYQEADFNQIFLMNA